MKRILFTLVVLIACTRPTAAAVWIRSYATAQAEAKKNKQLIFVDLFASWCGWCKQMEQEVFPSEVFQNATKNLVKLRLDTEDGGEGTKLARQFNVTSLPTFLLLTSDNQVAGVIQGYAPPNDFVAKLNSTEKNYDSFRMKLQQEPSKAHDYLWRLDLAKEFVDRRSYPDAEKRLQGLISDRNAPQTIRDQASVGLAISRANQGQVDQAITMLVAVLARVKTGDSADTSRFLLAQIYAQQGKYKASLDLLHALKATVPPSQYIEAVDQMIPRVEGLAAKQ